MRIKNVNGASRLSNFWNIFGAIQIISCRARLVTMDETWLYHYDPETKQQSMEWLHSGSSRPKNFECKNLLEKFSPRLFGFKTASSSLITLQRTKLSTRSITHLCCCNWRTFWRKKPREYHQGVLVLARPCPASPDTCNPEKTGLPGFPVSWLSTLFSGSDPFGLPHFSWTEKKQLKVRHSFPTRRSLLPRRPGWTDKILNFFEWLAKDRATG